MYGYEYGELEGRRGMAGEVENIRKDSSRSWCAANMTAFEHGTWRTVSGSRSSSTSRHPSTKFVAHECCVINNVLELNS